MSYSLDTNIIIALLDRTESVVRRHREAVRQQDGALSVSSIVVFELEVGVRKSARIEANEQRLYELLSTFAILPFTLDDARAAAGIRADLERRKQPIGPFDTLIAGQAVARGLMLVTRNVREFSRVPQLKWQDWTAAK